MNLFTYTKKLSEKISYYDRLTRDALNNFTMSNPFAPKQETIIIWVENCEDKNQE